MSKEDIKNSSRPFLYGIYSKHSNRACENLGISYDYDQDMEEQKTQLKESDYPKEFTKLSGGRRKETSDQWGSDEDFLSQFPGFFAAKYENERTFADHREITI